MMFDVECSYIACVSLSSWGTISANSNLVHSVHPLLEHQGFVELSSPALFFSVSGSVAWRGVPPLITHQNYFVEDSLCWITEVDRRHVFLQYPQQHLHMERPHECLQTGRRRNGGVERRLDSEKGDFAFKSPEEVLQTIQKSFVTEWAKR